MAVIFSKGDRHRGPFPKEKRDGKDTGEQLGQHGGNGGAGNAQIKDKDKDGV